MTQVLAEASVGDGAGEPVLGPESARIEARTPMQLAWARLRRDKVSLVAIAVIVLLVIIAITTKVWHPPFLKSPILQDHDHGVTVDGLPVSPNRHFLLGTDNVGRDILSRVVYGSQISLFVGLVATGLSLLLGVTVGMFAGYFSKLDGILQFIIDVVLSVPLVLFALALAAIFQPSLRVTIAVITFFSWPPMARIVRGQVLSLREKEFIEAARSLGASDLRIIFTDVLPNLIAPIIIYSTLILPLNILTEATLSFLSVGVPPPTPTWGNMLSDSLEFYRGSWWFFTAPGVALIITVLAFNLLGDGLRDALDPRAGRTMAKR